MHGRKPGISQSELMKALKDNVDEKTVIFKSCAKQVKAVKWDELCKKKKMCFERNLITVWHVHWSMSSATCCKGIPDFHRTDETWTNLMKAKEGPSLHTAWGRLTRRTKLQD